MAALAIAVGVILVLSGGPLAGHDAAGITSPLSPPSSPGVAYLDQGGAVLRPGELHPVYDSVPPTSGPHVPSPLPPDGSVLDDDQLLSALELGDVVLAYPLGPAPAGLPAVAAALAPPDRPALAATGQAVILAQLPRVSTITALAWAHMLRVSSPADPSLRAFVSAWLGRAAPTFAVEGGGG